MGADMRALIVLLAGLAFVSSAIAAPKFVSSEEFSTAVVDKTIGSKTKKGVPFTAVIKKGGTGVFTAKGKDPQTFTWDFKGNTFCWHFPSFTECSKVEIVSKKAANFYDSGSGKLNNAYVVK
jgi:hypothetical protein